MPIHVPTRFGAYEEVTALFWCHWQAPPHAASVGALLDSFASPASECGTVFRSRASGQQGKQTPGCAPTATTSNTLWRYSSCQLHQ